MKFETRREHAQRLKRQRRSGIIGIIAAFALVIVLGITMYISKVSLEDKYDENEAAKASLQAQITQQQERSQKLEEYKKYIQTKKFVEEMAKDKFGLIYPDEIIFKPNK